MVNGSVRLPASFSVAYASACVLSYLSTLLARHYKVAAPVLLPARSLLSMQNGFSLPKLTVLIPVGANALRNQELFHRRRAPVAQRQVVFRRAALVAMAFNVHLDRRIVLQEVRRL